MKAIVILSMMIQFLVLGCSTALPPGTNIDEKTPDGLMNLADYYIKNKRYQEGIAKLQALKSKYSYSKLAKLAELKIADVEYQRKSWPEAESAYRVFRELYPKYPKSDYVSFQLAMSRFNQLPSSVDRDLSDAYQAIRYFDDVIVGYPKSEWVKKSKENKNVVIKKLAEKEQYIASFYFIREHYLSALKRYENILTRFKGIGVEADALYKAAVSAYRINEFDKAKTFLSQLSSSYPNSLEYKRAKDEMKNEQQ